MQCCNVVGMGVIISVKLVVNYFIDTGGRHPVSWFEYFTVVCHVGFPLLFALRTVVGLLNYDSQAIGNHRDFCVFAFTLISPLQCLVKGPGKFHVHVGYQLRLYQI
jgi:hypothetical protein